MTENEIIELLKTREVPQAELEELLVSLGPAYQQQPPYLVRMNFIGSLRSQGFVIPRKRGVYSITGFEEKKYAIAASEWPEEQQEQLRWANDLEELQPTHEHWARLAAMCSRVRFDSSVDGLQHFSPAFHYCYYGIDTDRLAFLPDDQGVLIRRFANQPRFRTTLIPDTPRGRAVAQEVRDRLSKVSRRDIRFQDASEGRSYDGLGLQKYGTRVQTVYRLDTLADENHLLSQLPSRKRSYFRRNLAEMIVLPWRDMTNDAQKQSWLKNANWVIDTWKNTTPGQKQRQLAITRDFRAVALAPEFMKKTSFLFMRLVEGDIVPYPVAVMIFDQYGEYAVDIASKGLNYASSQPFGYHSTSLTAIHLMAKHLLQLGCKYYQAGGIDGGTEGLMEYKRHLVDLTNTPHSEGFRSSVELYWPDSSYTPPNMP